MLINLSITTQEDINIGFEAETEVDYDFGLDACYTGTYVATPRVYEQELSTANKTMIGDVRIKPIPYTDVGNVSGGRTAIIG